MRMPLGWRGASRARVKSEVILQSVALPEVGSMPGGYAEGRNVVFHKVDMVAASLGYENLN
jgi:hypothetical protein